MHNRLAHTAEHAFVGSMQEILGSSLSVRKVEHRENNSSLHIGLPELDLQTVIEAEHQVNSLIDIGRNIQTYSFETLAKAREHFPGLRANEERIKEKGQPIRVIVIEGHDVAACAMDHASNLRECEFFLVTGISRTESGSGYEIIFTVQNQAKEASMKLSWKLLRICQELGANINTLEDTVKRLNNEEKIKSLKLKRLTTKYLDKIKDSTLNESGNVRFIQDVMYGLDENEIRSFIGRTILPPNKETVVLITHIPNENENLASVIFARSQSLSYIECDKLFNHYSYLGARGGGKPAFVTGSISKDKVPQLMANLVQDIRSMLTQPR
jgi:alanyl-tRNA synthetase